MGCDGRVEDAGSDEMGRIDEQYQSLCGRNCIGRNYIFVKIRNLCSNIYCYLIFEWSFFMDK